VAWEAAYRAAGPRLPAWLGETLTVIDNRIVELVGRATLNDPTRFLLHEVLQQLDMALAYRRHYAERLEDGGKFFGVEVQVPPAMPAPRFARYWEAGGVDPRPRIAHLLTTKKNELDGLDADVEHFKRQAGQDFLAMTRPSGNRMQVFWQTINQTAAELFGEKSGGSIVVSMTRGRGVIFDANLGFGEIGSLDCVSTELDGFEKRRGHLLAEIATLEADLLEADKLVSDAVKKAVDAAGGRDTVIGHLHSAFCTGPPPEAASVENERRQCESALEAKRMDGISGDVPSVIALKEKLAQLAEHWQEVWRNRSSVQKARAKRLVEKALSGDESARGELQGIVASHPSDFRPGLADALADARLDRVLMAGLAQSLK
jgi:hypothetical protein